MKICQLFIHSDEGQHNTSRLLQQWNYNNNVIYMYRLGAGRTHNPVTPNIRHWKYTKLSFQKLS
jgi:hypothetical protein